MQIRIFRISSGLIPGVAVGETVLPFAGYACFPFWAGVAILTETLMRCFFDVMG